MQRTTAFPRPRLVRMLVALSAIAAAGAALAPLPALAQFQRIFGSTTQSESGSAVAQVSDGGYIAVGTNALNAYAVRTDAAGIRLWDKTFTLDGTAVANFRDVKVCANGDFIIVGTLDTQPGCTSGCRQLLAMRIADDGSFIWQRTFGDRVLNYIANSVVETQLGNGTTTHSGDFAIAGGAGDYFNENNALLLRLTADGDLVWAKTYDPNPSANDDFTFFGVDESRVGAGAGDIVATGHASFPVSGTDVVVARVDGASGNFGASPLGIAAFGKSNGDFAQSIIELRNGPFAGDLVIAGASSSAVPASQEEILMIETYPDPCAAAGQRADRFSGDHLIVNDIGFCVREITDPALGQPGDVVVAGATRRVLPGNDDQAFLQTFTSGTMAAASPLQSYGGSGGEVGFGVTERPSAFGGPGFVLTGFTNSQSPGFGNTDLYLVRTDAAMATPCDYDSLRYTDEAAGLQHRCLSIDPKTPRLVVLCGIQSLITDWGNELCHREGEQAPAPTLGTGSDAPAVSPSGDAANFLISYPNPVRQGDAITIDYATGTATNGDVLVSDIAGRTIYSQPIGKIAAASHLHIGTDGWAPGTYVIRVTSNGTTRTGRITVVAR